MFKRITEMAHDLVRERVSEGDSVVDATVGNGHDTLFLAQLVGKTGKVYGFDIQPRALENTKRRLSEQGCSEQVTLILDGHEHLDRYLVETTPVRAVMFNLGYLPGSDKKVTTHGETTYLAVQKALPLLESGGILTLVVYWGHETGKLEKEYLESKLSCLDSGQFLVTRYEYLNKEHYPPFLITVEKS
ncbi:MAG: methyltransferase domain-containing protein [Bacillaceae bacterium]|nr:methyltransferase domain-containing protein [Bacillaceae bacterium]